MSHFGIIFHVIDEDSNRKLIGKLSITKPKLIKEINPKDCMFNIVLYTKNEDGTYSQRGATIPDDIEGIIKLDNESMTNYNSFKRFLKLYTDNTSIRKPTWELIQDISADPVIYIKFKDKLLNDALTDKPDELLVDNIHTSILKLSELLKYWMKTDLKFNGMIKLYQKHYSVLKQFIKNISNISTIETDEHYTKRKRGEL